MFEIKKQLTNSRPPKATGKTLSTSPTPGTLKLSEAAAEAMEVKKGDYVGVVQGADDIYYLYKGAAGVDGKANDGSKVATANDKVSGTMSFSSANAYQALGGNEHSVETFTLEEGVEHEGKVYFALTHTASVAKQERKKSEKKDKEVADSTVNN